MSGRPYESTVALLEELRRAGSALSRCADLLEGHLSSTSKEPQDSDPGGPLLTGKQLGAIRVIARKAGFSRDRLERLIREATGKYELTRLSRAEASGLIDKLKSMNGSA